MILIDLETQNFPVESGIYEVACLVVRDYEIIDTLYLANEIEGYLAPRTHGYGFYDISQNDEYIIQFIEFISKYPYALVAHNCPFDKKFLVYYGWVDEDYLFYCSMRAMRRHYTTLESYSMEELLKYFGIAEVTDHRAMSDVQNLYRLLKRARPDEWIPVGVEAPRGGRRRTGGVVTKKRQSKKVKPRETEKFELPIPSTNILAEERICFTGRSIYKRDIMKQIALMNGAKVTKSVTSKTTLLVVGQDSGSKLDKAQAREISIVSDSDFLDMLGLGYKDDARSS